MPLLMLVRVATAGPDTLGAIPFEAGLRLVWVSSHSGEPDYESVLSVTSVGEEAASLRLAWNRGSDHRWKSLERPLSRRERTLGRAFYQYGKEADTNDFRGYALAMGTQAVLKRLREQGRAEVAFLLPEVARTPHRGTLTRVGPVPFTVLVDGRPVELPGIRARGTLRNPTSSIPEVTADIVFLDDPRAAWMLDSRVTAPSGEGRHRLVRVGTPASFDALETDLRERCRSSVRDLYFATASAEMDEASTPTLERIAGLLTANPGWRLRVLGHTDSIGTREANLDLSRRRAEVVRDALIAGFGISPDRLAADGRGEVEPVADDGTPEGRARNRRVDLERDCSATPDLEGP